MVLLDDVVLRVVLDVVRLDFVLDVVFEVEVVLIEDVRWADVVVLEDVFVVDVGEVVLVVLPPDVVFVELRVL